MTVFYIQFPVFNNWNSTHCNMLASFAVPSHCRFNNRLTLLTYNVCLICKCRLVQTKQPSYTIQVFPKQWRASDSPLLYNTTICNISFIELLVDHQQMSGTICRCWPEDAALRSRLDKLQSAAEMQATLLQLRASPAPPLDPNVNDNHCLASASRNKNLPQRLNIAHSCLQ